MITARDFQRKMESLSTGEERSALVDKMVDYWEREAFLRRPTPSIGNWPAFSAYMTRLKELYDDK